MIVARAPFRISFAGGGSDLPSFYAKHDYGAVLSTTINKYMYIMIHPYFHDKIRIKYSRTEDVESVEEIEHPLVRECLKLVGIDMGVEIASIADVPAGTGLGSSSTFTVCLLQALYAYKGKWISKDELAQKACQIEIDILGEPIGKQDQYAASFGQLNYIRFNRDETTSVDPILCPQEIRERLEKNLLMFYIGGERRASKILTEQKGNMKCSQKSNLVKEMVSLADQMKKSLNNGDIESVGKLLHEGWQLKKDVASQVSNQTMDTYYEKARAAGAAGGKVLGAGGGGFFLFYCEPTYQDKVRKALCLKELNFSFDTEGSRTVFSDV